MVIVGERHCHQAAKSMPRGSRVLVARSRYNFPGRASPLRAAPQSRMSPIMAYGSSSYDFAQDASPAITLAVARNSSSRGGWCNGQQRIPRCRGRVARRTPPARCASGRIKKRECSPPTGARRFSTDFQAGIEGVHDIWCIFHWRGGRRVPPRRRGVGGATGVVGFHAANIPLTPHHAPGTKV